MKSNSIEKSKWSQDPNVTRESAEALIDTVVVLVGSAVGIVQSEQLSRDVGTGTVNTHTHHRVRNYAGRENRPRRRRYRSEYKNAVNSATNMSSYTP